MNEKIQHTIQHIREKKKALDGLLAQEKQNNQVLNQELTRLNSELNLKENAIGKLREEQVELNRLLEETKNQLSTVSAKTNSISADTIDEMVREIEYCIGQLKNNA